MDQKLQCHSPTVFWRTEEQKRNFLTQGHTVSRMKTLHFVISLLAKLPLKHFSPSPEPSLKFCLEHGRGDLRPWDALYFVLFPS